MGLDFKRIPQNSRTIIFEKFNDREGMPNLCTMLKGRTSEEAVGEVNEKLLVHSFKEFREKFEPTVYERINIDSEGQLQSISYSLKSSDGGNPVSLCNHEFYKAVHNIIETKSNSGKSNEDSDYNKLYEALNPENIYNRARRQRIEAKEFLFNAMKERENKNPSGVKKWMRLAQNTFNDVKREYSGSALRLLPLAITDMKQVVDSRGGGEAPKAIETGAENAEALPLYSLKWDGNGVLKPVKQETKVLALEMQENSNTQIVTNQWQKVADSIPEGAVDKNLFMSIYAEQKNMALQTLPTDELNQRIDVMAKMYDHAQQSFFDAIGYLVQKVAGVEQFFRHAGDENGEVKAGVIIANCTVEDVFYSDEDERAVKHFLKSVGTSEKERIWFAVLPSASSEDNEWVPESVDNEMPDIENMDLSSFMEDETDNEKYSDVPVYSVGQINRTVNLLKECGILSFFNFCACEKTGFTQFEEKIFEQYKEESKNIDAKDSVVLAYPNFTVIPKNKSGFDSVSGETLYVPTVYIDAAYIAAGITVATQTDKIQQKKNNPREIIKNNPFVHFDLEKKENSRKFFANFNPECRLNMESELKNRVLGKEMGGFCFQSDTLVKQAFILTARTLDGRPVYQYLTKNYIDFVIEREQIKYESEAKRFEKDIINMVLNNRNDEMVNPILMSSEEFAYSAEEKEFSLRFKGVEQPMTLKSKIKDDID
ncbi:MAG: hypothetical protein K2I06_08565 [Ruminococcus sp.]|nr:hypothetical protein [Ruminococcus sp.]